MIKIKTQIMTLECEKGDSFVDATPHLNQVYLKFSDGSELFLPNQMHDQQKIQKLFEMIKESQAEHVTIDLTDEKQPVKFGIV